MTLTTIRLVETAWSNAVVYKRTCKNLRRWGLWPANVAMPRPLHPCPDRDDDHMQGHWFFDWLGNGCCVPAATHPDAAFRAEVSRRRRCRAGTGLGRTQPGNAGPARGRTWGLGANPTRPAGPTRSRRPRRRQVTDAAWLSDASADVVIGGRCDMQGNAAKHVVARAARVLRPRWPLRDSRTSAGAGRRSPEQVRTDRGTVAARALKGQCVR